MNLGKQDLIYFSACNSETIHITLHLKQFMAFLSINLYDEIRKIGITFVPVTWKYAFQGGEESSTLFDRKILYSYLRRF